MARTWTEVDARVCAARRAPHAIFIHVWAGIALNGKTELVILERNVTGETYGQLLQEHFVPFANATFGRVENCILQDDNAPPHRTAAVRHL